MRRSFRVRGEAGAPPARLAPVVGRARNNLFELMREHDPEGIVAQRLDDAYDPRIRWLKV
jgi:hypothetical protein